MKSVFRMGVVTAFSLICVMAASGQARSSKPVPGLKTPVENTLPQGKFQYRFISQHNIWSNRPLEKTAGKICKTMKDPAFAESPYAIHGQKDWNSCLYTQIQSIGYMRWLQNDGFKPTRKNRKLAKSFLERTYTMGHWGSYTLAQLRRAVKATAGQ